MSSSGSAVVRAARDDQLRQLRREEALETADPLELAHLRGDALLQSRVPLGKLGGLGLESGRPGVDGVVQRLDPQHGAHAGYERRLVDRLGQVLVAAGREARDHIPGVRHGGHQDDRREGNRRIVPQAPADLEAVELRHHDVEPIS